MLLAVSGPAAVFVACAVLSFLSFVAIAGIRSSTADIAPTTEARSGAIRELRAGFHALAGNSPVRLVVALFGAQAFVRGALGVLLVVVAIDLLGMGESGVGVLTASFGVGGVVGALRRHLARRPGEPRPSLRALPRGMGPAARRSSASGPRAPSPSSAWRSRVLANSLLDVSGFTSMQEGIDEAVIGRVFGLFELVVIATVGLGSLLAPIAIEALGSRGALMVAGGLLVVLAALAYRPLGRIDEGTEVRAADLELLGQTSIFGPLPYSALRRVASSLGERRAPAGEVLIRQGDEGDVVYVIAEGRVSVSRDGDALRELGRADVFGELALILDVPRTATVTASEPVVLRTVARAPFLAAVTGNQLSQDELRRLVAARTPTELASAG